ncbi:EAL domain-containing protein, partial [Prochlorothrix hollandica]|uniref:EAL domain-containing protein n=1 Tax=Prochlorothrix hollandica TaxID=1223 RepID=UPI0033413920
PLHLVPPPPIPLADVFAQEVLLRFVDTDGEILLPSPFLLAAERYKLATVIDRWVIQHFCEQYPALQQRLAQAAADGSDPSPVVYMINLSGASLKDDHLAQFITEQLATHQVPPTALCFEITETIAITNFTKADRFIRDLKTLGCQFALDDFGSGMASFSYLKHLPVDFIKVDGTFVQEILSDPINRSILEAIRQVGHSLGLEIIAEGVEYPDLLAALQYLGIDYAQGLGIAPPYPLQSQNPLVSPVASTALAHAGNPSRRSQ